MRLEGIPVEASRSGAQADTLKDRFRSVIDACVLLRPPATRPTTLICAAETWTLRPIAADHQTLLLVFAAKYRQGRGASTRLRVCASTPASHLSTRLWVVAFNNQRQHQSTNTPTRNLGFPITCALPGEGRTTTSSVCPDRPYGELCQLPFEVPRSIASSSRYTPEDGLSLGNDFPFLA